MIRRVAVLVRLRLHRETMASTDLCTRVYVQHPVSLSTVVSNRVHWNDWVQEIPCNSNSLNSYAVRLFSTVAPHSVLHVLLYLYISSVFHINRLDLKQDAHCIRLNAVQFGYNGCVCIGIILQFVFQVAISDRLKYIAS